MNADGLFQSLERFPVILDAIVRPLPATVATWKPEDDAWSILEIVSHLADEEVEDFRTRVFSTLADPTAPWPPIDPAGWVTQRDYASRSLTVELDRFLTARDESLRDLRALDEPDWSTAAVHPKFGSMSAGQLFGAWAAHDSLHLRQIARRMFEQNAADADPYSVGYAGEW